MYLVYAPVIRPFFWLRHQTCPHRILTDVLPLLCVAFPVPQPMMKPAGLKGSGSGMGFGKPVLPEAQPAFDGELQITRSAKQVEMVWHEQIIADQPSCGYVFPDLVQSAVDGSLRQPSFTAGGADGEKNPVRAAE